MWTNEDPAEDGWYLWRFSPPSEPSVLEPFLVYTAFGHKGVQEFSATREGAAGVWDSHDWLWRNQREDNRSLYPTEYLYLGPPNTNVQLIRAFRELYHAAVSAWRDLIWTPDLTEHGYAVRDELLAAINEIHKETD